jgi:hypothetical protein
MSSSDPGRSGLAGGSAAVAVGLISARWTDAAAGAKAGARGALAAAGAAPRPMAASKKAL